MGDAIGHLILEGGTLSRAEEGEGAEGEEERPMALKSKYSDVMQFNTLHIPKLKTLKGAYNYYEEHELNIDYKESQDQQNPSEAPMYVRIDWIPVRRAQPTVHRPPLRFHGITVKSPVDLELKDIEPANASVMKKAVIIIRK